MQNAEPRDDGRPDRAESRHSPSRPPADDRDEAGSGRPDATSRTGEPSRRPGDSVRRGERQHAGGAGKQRGAGRETRGSDGGRPGSRTGERPAGGERPRGRDGSGGADRFRGGERDEGTRRFVRGGKAFDGKTGGRADSRRPRRRDEPERVRPGLGAATDEPPTPADFDEALLPAAVKAELKGLSRETADIVGAHLVAAGELIDENPELAYRHAEAARRRAARLPIVREAAAEAAYAAGEYAAALREFRALRRMLGSVDYLAVIADCERALGRPRAALDTLREADPATLSANQRIEALIVEAGARSDLGQQGEAIRLLENAIQTTKGPKLALGRLRFAYAELLVAAGHTASAKEWLRAVANFDPDDELGASARLAELEKE